MRLAVFLILSSSAICCGQANRPSPDADFNMSCIERLQMPLYPPLADQVRIAGSLRATVVLNPDGSIQRTAIEMESGLATAKRLFTPAIEQALKASAFHRGCGGRSVHLLFHFMLDEELYPQSQRVSFGYPNQFWIAVPPKIVQW